MYQDFYQLNSDPFRLSPDHAFCFRYPSFAKAKAYMRYALQTGEGFVMVTGRPGMGKTTLINDMLDEFNPSDFLVATLVNTQLEASELLRMMAYDFGLNVQNLDKATILHKLKQFFIHAHQSKRPPLLIVDEAQNLSMDALEELRLLTNLQITNKPLLQIFMVGQEGLRVRFQQPNLEQFRQRIMAACHLEPLTLEQTTAYVIHRLRVAGWKGKPNIKVNAFPVIHNVSGGIPRRINRFCSRLLLHGCLEKKTELSVEDARLVVAELDDEHLNTLPAEHSAEAKTLTPDQSPADLDAELDTQSLLNEVERLLQEQEKSSPRRRVPDTRPDAAATTAVAAGVAAAAQSVSAAPAAAASAGVATMARERPRRVEVDPINQAQDQTHTPAPTLEPQQVSTPGTAHPAFSRPVNRPAQNEYDIDQYLSPPSRWPIYAYTTLFLLIAGLVLFAIPDRHIKRLIPDRFLGIVNEQSEPELDQPEPEIRDYRSVPQRQLTRIRQTPPSPRVDPAPVTRPLDSAVREPVVRVRIRPSKELPDHQTNSRRNEFRETTTRVAADTEAAPSNPSRIIKQVSFGFDSTKIRAKNRTLLNQVVSDMKASDRWQAHIIGYTDSVGPRTYNERLSRLRAEAVAAYLTKRGIPSKRLRIEGKGSNALIVSDDKSPPGKPPARLVQIILEPVPENI